MTKWLEKEDEFLKTNYLEHPNAKLSGMIYFVSGNMRSPGSISTRIKGLGLTGRKHGGARIKPSARYEKPVFIPAPHIPKIKVHMSNKKLLGILGERKTLKDVARAAKVDLDLINGYFKQGGMPKWVADIVEREFNSKAVTS